ncbi:hypothetical protein Agub_g8948 [Astrephomene gubernaculifera]|uniref:Uncharacterized protein n=1 Tax=Astrephomene gubernaculifera TaxID=47775 RepID=A0AAD3DSL2_9CHLO|nr:hypothetical protein Agub_g8948 [Astrephomene gubernaculifera]
MADDPGTRPIRRIKIKFGSTVVATQAVRTSGLTSSVSQDSKDAKSGSTLHLAKLRQASLQGYVPPSASADAIVARLREGEGFAPGCELPAWDFTAPPSSNGHERPTKRSRLIADAADGSLRSSGPASASDPKVAGGRSEQPGQVIGRAEPPTATDSKASLAKPDSASARAAAGLTAGSGDISSDKATNSHAYLALSPDHNRRDATGRTLLPGRGPLHPSSAGQSSRASSALAGSSLAPLQRSRPSAVGASTTTTTTTTGPAAPASAASESAASAVAQERGLSNALRGSSASLRAAGSSLPASTSAAPTGDGPSTSGRQLPSAPPSASARVPSGVSVETQTRHRDFPILPTSFLELPRLSGTALSFQSIGPFDLQLEKEQRPAALLEGRVDAHIEEARRTKREGDALCARNNRIWTIKSLSKYVVASLMFMEAADAMLRDVRRDSRIVRHAAGLYGQTAELLGHTVSYADMMKGNGVGKEALRLLAERLCAICLMWQASLLANNFRACAEKAQAALKEQQRQQGAHGAGAGSMGGPAACGPLPSPEDSSTSSLHAATTHGASGSLPPGGTGAAGSSSGQQGLPGFGQEQVAELLHYARITSRFSEYMRRSSKSFEAFLERSDVRQDQQAKLVCVHLAAVCMDMGMAPGLRIIHHAREAVRTMCEDLAR